MYEPTDEERRLVDAALARWSSNQTLAIRGIRPGRPLAGVMVVAIGPAAIAELDAACEYYEPSQAGLSRLFVQSLDQLFARLEAFPRSNPLGAGYKDVRRAVVRGFPYLVFHRLQPGRIDVLPVLHEFPRFPGRTSGNPWRMIAVVDVCG